MNIKPLVLIFTSLWTGQSFSKDFGHGIVHLNGQIIESACSIATDDVYQVIDLGETPISYLMRNELGKAKDFSIHLVNCVLDKESGGVWDNVSITFSGVQDNGRDDTFSVQGNAKGVGLRIYDLSSNVAKINQPMEGVELSPEQTTLNYKLRLVKNKNPMAVGNYTAFIRFMVQYH